MANITGLITVNGKEIIEVDADPSSGPGTSASIGSLAMFNNGGVGVIYFKAGALDTEWSQIDFTPSWDLSGNALTGTEVFGSTNNFDVPMIRNNAEIMRLVDGGLLIGLNAVLGGFAGRLTMQSSAPNANLSVLASAGISPAVRATRMHKVLTTGNVAEAFVLSVPDNYNALINFSSVVRQTAAGTGNIGDGAAYQRTIACQNLAGTVNIFRTQTDFTYEVAPQMNVEILASGAGIEFNLVPPGGRDLSWGIYVDMLLVNS